jgi:hypothetical protein
MAHLLELLSQVNLLFKGDSLLAEPLMGNLIPGSLVENSLGEVCFDGQGFAVVLHVLLHRFRLLHDRGVHHVVGPAVVPDEEQVIDDVINASVLLGLDLLLNGS